MKLYLSRCCNAKCAYKSNWGGQMFDGRPVAAASSSRSGLSPAPQRPLFPPAPPPPAPATMAMTSGGMSIIMTNQGGGAQLPPPPVLPGWPQLSWGQGR